MRFWFLGRRLPQASPAPPPEAAAGEDFASALVHAADAQAQAPIPQALARVKEALPACDNVGRTGDARDVYHHLDDLASAVAAQFPESLCKAGCSACCYYPVGLFTTGVTEWNVIRRHIETHWSPERQAAFVERFRRRYPFWALALVGALQNSVLGLVAGAPWISKLKLSCPFLEDGRCSVYAARPYQCRSFGLFACRSGFSKAPKLYACAEQGGALWAPLSDPARGGVQLPVLNPLVRRLKRFCAKGPQLALPLWVAGWARRRATGGLGPAD